MLVNDKAIEGARMWEEVVKIAIKREKDVESEGVNDRSREVGLEIDNQQL